ncbi:Cytochrome P450 CYP4, partial [Frankliniella occidentalis]
MMTLSSVWPASEMALLLLLLLLALLAFGVFKSKYFDPAAIRARRIAEGYPQYSSLPVIGHLLHVLRPRNLRPSTSVAQDVRQPFGPRLVW